MIATVASWNFVLIRLPSWTSRANRCSTTTRRARYSSVGVCASWGCTLGWVHIHIPDRTGKPAIDRHDRRHPSAFPPARWPGNLSGRTGATGGQVHFWGMFPVGPARHFGHQPASRVAWRVPPSPGGVAQFRAGPFPSSTPTLFPILTHALNSPSSAASASASHRRSCARRPGAATVPATPLQPLCSAAGRCPPADSLSNYQSPMLKPH